ncbi:KAT8 regulatory NSL complex subunit 2-like isoform X2 [Anneissia japonica]|nr:KAT8 regulatory NSL complex subunit 2-like isoform X2 [Anneissia japonica]XP_033099668.1 KAT8 regulatory NSL complex subunit 2-like isoform X2 [Anneissia japonica]XP_033099669.1 KAT8 regulatory NSL complex subunit 2-like isoform X2 [Anneissia japonica]
MKGRPSGSSSSRRTLRSESLFCNYSPRICMQNRMDGFEYCRRHILEDKSAPFKQCNYISTKNGKRCSQAAPKSDKKDGFCVEHSRKTAMLRHKNILKKRPSNRTDTLLEDLDAYRASSSKQLPENPLSEAAKILEYGSDSSSDVEPLLVDQSWKGDNESDAESVDSEQEDVLKHAGVYTAEEVALISKEKLIRLQSLYINQFKRLQHVMREKRRRYLAERSIEEQTIGLNIGKVSDPKESKKLMKLHAMKRYRKRRGCEALLALKSKQRRIQVTAMRDGVDTEQAVMICKFEADRKSCRNTRLPAVSYCEQHILEDRHQVLYGKCEGGDGNCTIPVLLTSNEITCFLHTVVPIMHSQGNLAVITKYDNSQPTFVLDDHDYGQKPSTKIKTEPSETKTSKVPPHTASAKKEYDDEETETDEEQKERYEEIWKQEPIGLPDSDSTDSSDERSSSSVPSIKVLPPVKKYICKCGINQENPESCSYRKGKYMSRCKCYHAQEPCAGWCKCKGCVNPYGANKRKSKKKKKSSDRSRSRDKSEAKSIKEELTS